MGGLLATVGAYSGLGLLLVSGVAHAARPGRFRDDLARQQVWAPRLVVPAAVAVAALELAVGLLGLAAVALPGRPGRAEVARAGALLAAGLLYLAFAGYAALLLARRPGVPCACSPADHPTNAAVPLRALAFAAGCSYAAVASVRILPWSRSAGFLVAMLAAACFLVLGWSIPAALHDGRPPPVRPTVPDRQGPRTGRHPQELTWTSRPAP